MLTLSLAATLSTTACVMPQHRGVASLVNGALVATGGALAVSASADEANPGSWNYLAKDQATVGGAMILLGLVGEVLTLGLHRDDLDDPRPSALRPSDPPMRGGTALTTLRVSVP